MTNDVVRSLIVSVDLQNSFRIARFLIDRFLTIQTFKQFRWCRREAIIVSALIRVVKVRPIRHVEDDGTF